MPHFFYFFYFIPIVPTASIFIIISSLTFHWDSRRKDVKRGNRIRQWKKGTYSNWLLLFYTWFCDSKGQVINDLLQKCQRKRKVVNHLQFKNGKINQAIIYLQLKFLNLTMKKDCFIYKVNLYWWWWKDQKEIKKKRNQY